MQFRTPPTSSGWRATCSSRSGSPWPRRAVSRPSSGETTSGWSRNGASRLERRAGAWAAPTTMIRAAARRVPATSRVTLIAAASRPASTSAWRSTARSAPCGCAGASGRGEGQLETRRLRRAVSRRLSLRRVGTGPPCGLTVSATRKGAPGWRVLPGSGVTVRDARPRPRGATVTSPLVLSSCSGARARGPMRCGGAKEDAALSHGAWDDDSRRPQQEKTGNRRRATRCSGFDSGPRRRSPVAGLLSPVLWLGSPRACPPSADACSPRGGRRCGGRRRTEARR